ncbi:hypothetical protein B8W66_23765, partial [Mycobacterium decipiens]
MAWVGLQLFLDILGLNPIGLIITLVTNAQLLIDFGYNVAVVVGGLLYAMAGVIEIIYNWIIGNLFGAVPLLTGPLLGALGAAVVPGVAGLAGVA